jgi:L,D-peptidoglycan transpeptidase YkuD (ErfK/YbiS/YcfS/YnhG family)
VTAIRVRPDSSGLAGRLVWPGGDVPCALGKGGVRLTKREGDGATPVGTFPLRRLWFREDRLDAPPTGLMLRSITAQDGWCDDPSKPEYNRPVTLPFEGSHEKMTREDGLYDLVVELGYNDDPPVAGRGSAIFLHVARDGYAPTEGCIALERNDLLRLLADCGPGSTLTVQPPATSPAG